MVTIDKRIADLILIAKKYPTIKRIGIFGSYARGDGAEGSDMDLLYDYDETHEDGVDELLEYVEGINDVLREYAQVPKIDYVWYKGVMESQNTSFKKAVLNDVIWIYNAET